MYDEILRHPKNRAPQNDKILIRPGRQIVGLTISLHVILNEVKNLFFRVVKSYETLFCLHINQCIEDSLHGYD